MGKRGPQKTPTARLKLHNSPLVMDRNSEPESVGTPTCPDWLPSDAKEEWAKILPHLIRMRVLDESNYMAVAQYCIAVGNYKAAQYEHRKMEWASGTVERRRVEIAAAETLAALMRTSAKLGLSPADRPNVKATHANAKESRLDKVLNLGRKGRKEKGA